SGAVPPLPSPAPLRRRAAAPRRCARARGAHRPPRARHLRPPSAARPAPRRSARAARSSPAARAARVPLDARPHRGEPMAVLVTRPAPDFTCAAVLPDGSIDEGFRLSTALAGKYGLLVFYPLDFTFVCPSELIALDHRVDALRERNVEVISVSIDSQYTHHAWRSTSVDAGGIGPVRYTMAADV